MLLANTTALITGGGRGIGQGIALAFAGQGCDVAVAARTRDEVEETAAQVRALGRRALALCCDVSSPADVSAMCAVALDQFGHVDILVNNAGYACFKPIAETSEEEWRRTLDVNLTGPFLCIQALLPSMMARGSGRIINVSSVAGLKPILRQGAYCASKSGLSALTKVLAMELREYGIRVQSVCPGGVDTRLSQEAMPDRDRSAWMTPEDIAHACLFLATQSGRAVTDEVMVRRFGSVPLGG